MRLNVFTSRSQQGASLRLKKSTKAMIRSDPPPKTLLMSGRKVKGPFIYVLCVYAYLLSAGSEQLLAEALMQNLTALCCLLLFLYIYYIRGARGARLIYIRVSYFRAYLPRPFFGAARPERGIFSQINPLLELNASVGWPGRWICYIRFLRQVRVENCISALWKWMCRSAIRVIVFQNSRCMLHEQGRFTHICVRVDQLHLMGRRREICH